MKHLHTRAKLVFQRETLRVITAPDLARIIGGAAGAPIANPAKPDSMTGTSLDTCV